MLPIILPAPKVGKATAQSEAEEPASTPFLFLIPSAPFARQETARAARQAREGRHIKAQCFQHRVAGEQTRVPEPATGKGMADEPSLAFASAKAHSS